MTKESSLRIVKLSDGSEIIGCINLTDEGSQFLRITEPLEILMNSKAIGIGMVEDFTSLRPWMQFANDSVFSIPKERIMTISNVADDMKAYYKIINEKVKERAKIKRQPLTEKDIADRQLPNTTSGVVITKIENDSPVNYLNINDIIIEAQKRNINTPGDLNIVVNSALRSAEKNILIVIYNNQNQKRYIGVKIE